MRWVFAAFVQLFLLIALIQLIQPLVFLPVLEGLGIQWRFSATLFSTIFLILGFYLFLSFGFIIEIVCIGILLIAVSFIISRIFALTPKNAFKTQLLFFLLCLVLLLITIATFSLITLFYVVPQAHFELSFLLAIVGGLLGSTKKAE